MDMARISAVFDDKWMSSDEHLSFEGLCHRYGFRHYTILALAGITASRTVRDRVLDTNWSEEMITLYDEADVVGGSPVIARLMRETVPIPYDVHADAGLRKDGRSGEEIALAEQCDMPRGACLPVHTIDGSRGVVIFGGSRRAVSVTELKELYFLSGVLFDDANVKSRTGIIRRDKRGSDTLSRRETECLTWAATGRTTLEIAQILKLSEYTVNHYLARATRKLGSVNRTQTVSKALRAGLIK